MRFLVLSIMVPVLTTAQTWVPYSAHYLEKNTVTEDGTGRIISSSARHSYEVREVDGSTATFIQVNGHNESGKIWFACGDVVSLDYTNKLATISHDQRQVKKHFRIPEKDKPIGTNTIAKLNVTGWPVHFNNGSGSLWVDTTNDVIAKSEAHFKGSNGSTTDYVKELQSIDLTSPVDSTVTKLPQGFGINTVGLQQSCGSL